METETRREPLGDNPYLIRISRKELEKAHQHRQLTGEQIQSFVRRLIREYDLGQDQELHQVLNPNDYVRDFVLADGPSKWKHKDLVKRLYEVDQAFSFLLFSPKDEIQPVLPQSVIAVSDMRHEVLAAYRLTYNPNGLYCEIIHNEKHINRPFWAICESHLHERIHQMQEYLADQKVDGYLKCKNGWHNLQFVELANSVGLHPRPGIGSHWRPADGMFERAMSLLGIAKPREAEGEWEKPEKPKDKSSWWDNGRSREKGRSTLVLYTADKCSSHPVCKIRAGRTDLQIRCLVCEGDFRPHHA